MKKTILSLAVVLASLAIASAQGTIKFFNINSSYLVSTPTGPIATSTASPNGYYFALLTSSSAPSSSDPLTGGWTVAQSGGANLVGNNYLVAGGISGNGGANGVAVDNWAAGATKFVEIVGWSVSLGTSWSQISAQLTSGNWNADGFYGISSQGQVASGGVGTPASPAAALFGATGQIANGWTLAAVTATPTPEPTTLALAALGGISMLLIRRRK